MPAVYLEKYFGREDFKVKNDKQGGRTRKFLAKELDVKPESITFGKKGEILLTEAAAKNLSKKPIDDDSFLVNGGKAEALYEGLEMAYNDVMSGTVQAGGSSLTAPLRNLYQHAKKLAPVGLTTTMEKLRESGALEVLTGAGAGATFGVGIWLARSGFKQVNQGLARGDAEQTLKGGRHLFLGGESILTGAALASKLGSGALLKTAGAVAKTLAAPFALVHGAIDIAEGVHHIKNGIKNKDLMEGLEGVAEVGMGVGWVTAAFGATPAVVAVSCACLAGKMGIAVVRSRKRAKEKAKDAQRNEHALRNMLPNSTSRDEGKEIQLSKEESSLLNRPLVPNGVTTKTAPDVIALEFTG